MTEICDDESPRFITNVHTTLSTITDEQAIEPIHEVLEERELLPDEHFLDTGYPTSENLVTTRTQYDVEIIAPVRIDPALANEGKTRI